MALERGSSTFRSTTMVSPDSSQGASAIPWTEEARRRLERAPEFVRPGIVKLMERRARERGRRVIDSTFLTEIRNESMLRVARCIRGFGFEELTQDAFEVAKARMRKLPHKVEVIEAIQAFLADRTEKNEMVLAKFRRYLTELAASGLPWTEEALARLQRVPDGVRPLVRQAAEAAARALRAPVVSGEAVDRALGREPARPCADVEAAPRADGPVAGVTMLWTAEAEERLRRIPLRPVREMVARRTEAWARAQGLKVVDLAAWEAARAAAGGPP